MYIKATRVKTWNKPASANCPDLLNSLFSHCSHLLPGSGWWEMGLVQLTPPQPPPLVSSFTVTNSSVMVEFLFQQMQSYIFTPGRALEEESLDCAGPPGPETGRRLVVHRTEFKSRGFVPVGWFSWSTPPRGSFFTKTSESANIQYAVKKKHHSIYKRNPPLLPCILKVILYCIFIETL